MDSAILFQELDGLTKEAGVLFAKQKADAAYKFTDAETERLDQIDARTGEIEGQLNRLAQQGRIEHRFNTWNASDGEPLTTKNTPGGESFDSGWKSDKEFFSAVIEAGKSPSRTDERLINCKFASGHSEAIDSEGGFLLKPDIADGILRNMHETGKLASKCFNFPMSQPSREWNAVNETSRATGSRGGGIRVYRVPEAGTLTGSKTDLKKVRVDCHKMTALVEFTSEQVEDTPELMALINQLVPEEFAFKLDAEIFSGTGASGECLGIMNSPAKIEVAKETAQPGLTVMFENLAKMEARLWPRSISKAVWYINQNVKPQLYTMSLAVGTGGIPVFMPANGAAGAPFGTLFGRPIEVIEQAESVGTAGDIVLADLSQYLLGTRGGMKTAMSIHVRFLTDEQTLRFTLRVGGSPWWNAPMTPYKGTADTTSPFVALATRA